MDFSWLLGHARIDFTTHPKPVALHNKVTSTSTNLLEFCKSATPPCRLNPFLFNGHLQTFWTATKATDIPIYYKRRIFSAVQPEFAGTFAVDFVVPAYPETDVSLPPRTTYFSDVEFSVFTAAKEVEAEDGEGDDAKPVLIVLHGLSGGSHEIYLRAALKPLVDAGWAACVVNSRGCAMSAITTGVLYNARATWDVRQVVRWARKTWPGRKLFGIGFSLGANILTNYLGEEGERCLLTAAVVCSSPWNLEVSSMALQRSWIGLNVYSRTMGSSMKQLFERHVEQISKNPRVNVERVRSIKYLHEFDRELQGPTWGYPTEGAYYRDASSCDSLCAIRIPVLAINATDDPIAHREAIPFLEFTINPYTVLCTTSVGGHLSWFEIGGTRWFAKPAFQFLIKMAEGFEVEKPEIFENGAPILDGVSVADRAPTFKPMHRRMKMAVDG